MAISVVMPALEMAQETGKLVSWKKKEGDSVKKGELLLEVALPAVERSVYLKAMDRKRWSFPQVGVAAARVGGETRIALAGVASVPWLLGSVDDATPLPRTAWKVPVAPVMPWVRTLVFLSTRMDM